MIDSNNSLHALRSRMTLSMTTPVDTYHPAIVGVIILNWNNWHETVESAAHVRQSDYLNIKLYIIDNASTDDSVEQIKSGIAAPYQLIQSKVNSGWAGGNNLGIAQAISDGCDYVFLLNADANVTPSAISALVSAAEKLPNAAALGSVVMSAGNPEWVEYAGSTLVPETGHVHHISGKLSEFDLGDKPIKSVQVKGCSMLLTRQGLSRIGMLAEDYFLNFDESDWCHRAMKAGMDIFVIPASRVHHIGATTMGGTESPLYRYFITRNRLLFSKRHLGSKGLAFAWRCALWEYKNALFINKTALIVHRLISIASITYGIRDYLLGRFGDCPNSIRALTRYFKKSVRS